MDKILIIGAGGQIGVELTQVLSKNYGRKQVIVSDLKEAPPLLIEQGNPYYQLNATDAAAVAALVKKERITQIYLLAAILSATGENKPLLAWDVNMGSLLGILEICRTHQVKKLYWPSSIAVFGPNTPKQNTPQQTVIAPTTVYGISKYAGELWCKYYFDRYGLDVRSIRYPGLISWKVPPGGGTTDYAVEIYHQAIQQKSYTCFLKSNTRLPMMYMDDAIRATIELMEAPLEKIKNRLAYNLAGMSFTPAEIASSIKMHIPDFKIDYQPDSRQQIAESWPQSINDDAARHDWSWEPAFDLEKMTKDMLRNLQRQ